MNDKNWSKLWLDYDKKLSNEQSEDSFSVAFDGFSEDHRIIKSAKNELTEVFSKLFKGGYTTEIENAGKSVCIKKTDEIKNEGYRISADDSKLTIEASDENGVLYGAFHVIKSLLRGTGFADIKADEVPSNPLRMMNHWDNMDGSIERGYSGRSFFFENDNFYINDRTRDYARMMASIGINGIVINNVNVKNAASYLITERYFDKVSELSELFADYGIKLYLSLNFASPIELGGLEVCDPLDENVISWWDKKFKEVYENVPLLGGFLVKADSEGRPGPFTYGRNQADGANMLAKAIAPYNGIIIWRCFVYNCTQDWRDYKTDRARAGYDYFKGLDGEFLDNVILQIKNGPMDFQIREPVSPLLGGLTKTNQMLEVQIAQEYTGHQIDLCYLMPMFKEVLDFHTHCKSEGDTVADVVSGRALNNKNAGMAAVINTGDDANWTGNYLAAANLYGFGRLAYNTELSSEDIAREWIQLSFDLSKENEEKLVSMLLRSREIYEKYTSPLGIGWMVTPHEHYGPSVDGYEYSRWGTYHRADHLGLGVDRTDKGTGYAQQYYPENADMYNDSDTCPEELLLFFHHIAYDRKLKDGRTLIQYIYDSHFEGEAQAEELYENWKSMEKEIPSEVFALVCHRFEMQIANAKEWRDQVNSYFYRKSGIPDEKGRDIF
ncbi:glycoside hydrolase family 20 zincin-like fold domain-containing protein [Butyrivibrio sp. LC3010]|uniref:glycoside hydrolase family 20 zincin-like fold domain-containing protein n=1 Tax=Butyrivibrio sp. LC3010 TaxID=1280680 RepID=UPI00040F42A7|nr:glycoside hydrolase family 20 zincin-like fold domain-containing protein [Butyrivibrio sp. LC3010]